MLPDEGKPSSPLLLPPEQGKALKGYKEVGDKEGSGGGNPSGLVEV